MATFLTAKQLAERWQVHPETIRSWEKQKRIPRPIRNGRWVRWSIERIKAWEHKRTMLRGL